MNPFQALPPPDFAPFLVCAENTKAPYPRALSTREGLGDRFRFVAFAEKQASLAFSMAPLAFPHVPQGVKKIWQTLAIEENKHLKWLLWRMEELKMDLTERPVSDALWKSFGRCKDEHEFANFMANAEERGRVAGEQFYETLLKIDEVSARVFKQIADEECQHIRLAQMIIDQNFQIPLDFDPSLKVLGLHEYSALK